MNAFDRARTLATKNSLKSSTESDKTLVIIDMQSHFMDCEERDIVPVICSLVNHAIKNNWAIIVVEFEGNGDTDDRILDSLAGYQHWTTIYKGSCDGGQQVVSCINKNPTWSLNTLVCGIYGPQCVASTVSGMFRCSELVEIDVISDAVFPEYRSIPSYDHDEHCNVERIVTVDDVTADTLTDNCNTHISA